MEEGLKLSNVVYRYALGGFLELQRFVSRVD